MRGVEDKKHRGIAISPSLRKGKGHLEEHHAMNEAIVYMNGEFVPWHKATIHLLSHSVARGSAIFEVLGFQETQGGRAIFRLHDHVDRLFRTAELLDMEIPLSREECGRAVLNTVRKSGAKDGMIKIVCYYPQIVFDVHPPHRTLDVAVCVIDSGSYGEGSPGSFDDGATVGVSRWRKLNPGTVPIEAKAAANYLNGMVARSDTRKRGFDFALMCDTEGYIAEGATESIFLVQGNTLLTPALGWVLDGITRRSLLEVARAEGMKTEEARLPFTLLFEADEIFLSGTPKKLIPVKKIEDRVMKDVPGPVTRVLSGIMEKILNGEDRRFEMWCTTVDVER